MSLCFKPAACDAWARPSARGATSTCRPFFSGAVVVGGRPRSSRDLLDRRRRDLPALAGVGTRPSRRRWHGGSRRTGVRSAAERLDGVKCGGGRAPSVHARRRRRQFRGVEPMASNADSEGHGGSRRQAPWRTHGLVRGCRRGRPLRQRGASEAADAVHSMTDARWPRRTG